MSPEPPFLLLWNMLLVKEGFIVKEFYPLKELLPEEGALTLRTIWRLFVGEGNETISKAILSMSRPNLPAMDSKSASLAAASLWIFKAVLIY